MKFLLTNDDGIAAPGLAALEQALCGLGDVAVVAPLESLSGCSHQVTTNRPLQVTKVNALRHAVDGTPADCIRLGLLSLALDADWVMAGVNDGANLGVDVFMSGAVAAVREATLFGTNLRSPFHNIAATESPSIGRQWCRWSNLWSSNCGNIRCSPVHIGT